ncbi:Clavaminate synthase-like protein [Patellaria atrata CBS 101060]|uniref:Clavaminate synthase-like protein n=1 Tax=Patellaria atrata CBS 101060 TaxID=1346257 RepID=A0A9P4VP37_9PEZI|nr:Clavaminate synthase-like protein [Patellaria atrata CBS 101060]
MSPSAVPVDDCQPASYEDDSDRPIKRVKLSISNRDGTPELGVEEISQTVPPHPLGIKPSGNAYSSDINIKDACGGFQILPDELVIQVLEYLNASSLVALGATCKALYAFTRAEELWKSLFIEYPLKNFTWKRTWRSTYLNLPSYREAHVSCRNLFSDALYRPYFCTYTSLRPYTTAIPAQNEIQRLTNLTQEEFNSSWLGKPFILTSPVKEWPVYWQWTIDNLLKRYHDTSFRAEAVDWLFHHYISYMRDSSDESPLYLFDSRFVEKMGLTVGRDEEDASYWIPDCFGGDLFNILGDQRPNSRWLIIGPTRSGSTFHKDPNATSAWNAVIQGSKYWIMFPPSKTGELPPGIFLSADQSEITSPLSIAEYLLEFHALARKTPGCKEGICYRGEVLYVPSGWFHLVLNLEDGIAITQNFVPRARLGEVLTFLKDMPEQVSGFKDEVVDPYGLLTQKLREQMPEILEEALKGMELKAKGSKAKWEELTRSEKDEEVLGGGFIFGFGGDEEDDDEIP